MNETDRSGQTALHVCQKPELVAFYVRSGASLTAREKGVDGYTALHRAIADAIQGPPLAHGMERARIIASGGTNSIEGERIERLLRTYCGKEQYQPVCASLSQFIRASPGVFEGVRDSANPAARSAQAAEVSDREPGTDLGAGSTSERGAE